MSSSQNGEPSAGTKEPSTGTNNTARADKMYLILPAENNTPANMKKFVSLMNELQMEFTQTSDITLYAFAQEQLSLYEKEQESLKMLFSATHAAKEREAGVQGAQPREPLVSDSTASSRKKVASEDAGTQVRNTTIGQSLPASNQSNTDSETISPIGEEQTVETTDVIPTQTAEPQSSERLPGERKNITKSPNGQLMLPPSEEGCEVVNPQSMADTLRADPVDRQLQKQNRCQKSDNSKQQAVQSVPASKIRLHREHLRAATPQYPRPPHHSPYVHSHANLMHHPQHVRHTGMAPLHGPQHRFQMMNNPAYHAPRMPHPQRPGYPVHSMHRQPSYPLPPGAPFMQRPPTAFIMQQQLQQQQIQQQRMKQSQQPKEASDSVITIDDDVITIDDEPEETNPGTSSTSSRQSSDSQNLRWTAEQRRVLKMHTEEFISKNNPVPQHIKERAAEELGVELSRIELFCATELKFRGGARSSKQRKNRK